MRRLLGVVALVALLVLAWHWSYSVSGWLFWGLLPALWLDRQWLRTLPWAEERKPLLGAVLWRLAYVAGGTALLLPYYPAVPLREAFTVGVALTWLAFGFELLLGLASRQPAVAPQTGALVAAVPRPRGASFLFALALAAPILILLPLRSFHQFHTQAVRTPGDAGLPYEEVQLTTSDGLELAAWYVPHSQPRGAIIFCHGHGGNRQHVLNLLPVMHELGLAVLAFDFRGQGESPGHTLTFGAREVADVVAAEAFLAQRHPDLPLFFSGVSYGGGVGLQALPHLKHVQAAWIDSGFARLTDIAENHFAIFPAPARRGLIHFYSAVLWCDCGFWGPDVSPVDRLKDIRIPIHFTHGTADTLIPFVQAQEMYDAYAGPKQCYWMEGATHFKRSAEISAEYLRRFRGFIQEHVSK